MKLVSLNKAAVAALTIAGLSVVAAGNPNPTITATTTSSSAVSNAAPTNIILPTRVELPPVPAEVLRLSEAGVSEDVIIAYIKSTPNNYILDANQIVYLRDEGISSAVLTALVSQSQAVAGNPATPMAEPPGNPTEPPTGPSPTEPAAPEAPPPVTGDAVNYYGALAPYGTWVNVPAYGWCWQPTVVVVNRGWQPYCHGGCWMWTNCGWYWNSCYSWGWAPFHYGRWYQHATYGWMWCPDRVWGPSWVCWRNYPGYCGWAPLPPGACFAAGHGWTFNGIAVSASFGFGLGSGCFTFCGFNNFCNPHPYNCFVHGQNADHFFHGSTVNNNFAADGQHGFVNRGVDPSQIEAASHLRVAQVAVRELPHGTGHGGNATMPDRLTRDGNGQVIYRPGQNMAVPKNSFLPGRETHMASRPGGFNSVHGFGNGRGMGNAPQSQWTRANGAQRSMSGAAWNSQHGSEAMRYWGGAGNFRGQRSATVGGYVQSNPNAWGQVPIATPGPLYGQAGTPSHGGMHSGGGGHANGGGNWGGSGGNWGGGMAMGGGFHR